MGGGSGGMPIGNSGIVGGLSEQGSASAYFHRDLIIDTVPSMCNTDPIPIKPFPKIPSGKGLNSKSEANYTPPASPPSSRPCSPPGTPPYSPPDSPLLNTPPLLSSPGNKTPGLARRGTFNLIGKATDFGDTEMKKKKAQQKEEKELTRAKEKEKLKEKELEKRKEKERAREERDKERKRNRASVKFDKEDLEELPDEHLVYELDDIVFKDGKERIKLKNKGGSLPSSLRKSKSFLRSLAQKWTLSSKPPSYPPPHIPEAGLSQPPSSTEESSSSSYSDSDSE